MRLSLVFAAALALGCAGWMPAPTRVVVTVAWDGSSPLEVERQLLAPIEDALAAVPAVRGLEGRADEGLATVTFLLEGDDLGAIRDAVEGVRPSLPEDAQFPVISRTSEPRWIAVPMADADRLRAELLRTPGIVGVEAHGLRTRQIVVRVDGARLAAYGLDVGDVITSLQACSVELPAGRLAADGIRLRVTGPSPEELPACPVRDGIGLRDVASIADDLAPPDALSPDGAVVLEVRGEGPLPGVDLGAPARVRPTDLGSLRRSWPAATLVAHGDEVLAWGDLADVPGVSVFRGTGTRLVVSGEDLSVLDELTAKIREDAAKRGAATWTEPGPASPELTVHLDREKAASLGIPAERIALALGAAGGAGVGHLGDVPIRVEVDSPSGITDLVVRGPGGLVPLTAVATLTEQVTRPIVHVDRRRAVIVEVRGEVPPVEAPAGYTVAAR